MERIIRIFTAGKAPSEIDTEIAEAIESGSRVLVKAGTLSANFPENTAPETHDGENGAIARWAEQLSQDHGLVWQRVGPDVLFTRAVA